MGKQSPRAIDWPISLQYLIRMRKPKVEILVGPIASGKSTFATFRAKEGAIVINDDAIVNAVHANQYALYDETLKPLYKAVENTILQAALSLGRDVVIDRPNYSKAMRRRYIGLAKSVDAMVNVVHFERVDPNEHARRRAHSDARGYTQEYWLEVAMAHDIQYEQPELSEGVDEITHRGSV